MRARIMRSLFAVLLLILGLELFAAWRWYQVRSAPEFRPSPSGTELQPPTRAVTGTLAETDGAVRQKLRLSDGFTDATLSGTISHGDSLATAIGTATASISGTLVTLGEHAEVVFSNLVPGSFVFWQKSGPVRYAASESVSVRLPASLAEVTGEADIIADPETVTVEPITGTVRLGVIDRDNVTHTYTAKENETLTFDTASGTVDIR